MQSIDDPWPECLRPIDPLLTRQSIRETIIVSSSKPSTAASTLRDLVDKAKVYRVKKIRNDAIPRAKVDRDEAL